MKEGAVSEEGGGAKHLDVTGGRYPEGIQLILDSLLSFNWGKGRSF